MMNASPLILALGDSLVAGYGLARADGFAAQLEARLRVTRPGARVLNAGVSGDTTGDVLRRLPRVLSALETRPDLAIVQVGPNDVLRQTPPARTRAQLDAILVELGRIRAPVLLTTVEPPALVRDRAQGHLGIHPELGALHGATLHPFFPPGVLGRAGMVLADRVHPNAAAIAAVVTHLLPAVERLLDAR
jgi:acyl-CoA thioesterase I